MLNQAKRPLDADQVFRRKFRQKLAARGYAGQALDRKVDEMMNAPVRFRLDLSEDAASPLPRNTTG